jgi:hypothetical protein
MKLESMLGRALAATVLATLAASPARAAEMPAPATPTELVTAYDALADTILAANKAEKKLVLSILATSYAHARAERGRARQALQAGDAAGARVAVENLATAIGQIGTEGDNAVAGIRKRLLEGGHHANAEGEAQGIYDEGYVVITKAAKQAFLDGSRALAQLAKAPKAEAMDAEWQKVEAAWAKHVAAVK